MATGIDPVDYATPTGMVRLLAADAYNDPDNGYIVSDDAIAALLALVNSNVKLAAALVLRAIAADETLIGRVVQTDDLKINGNVTGEQLRKLASDLEAQAYREEGADAFAIVFPVAPNIVPEASAMPFLFPPVNPWL